MRRTKRSSGWLPPARSARPMSPARRRAAGIATITSTFRRSRSSCSADAATAAAGASAPWRLPAWRLEARSAPGPLALYLHPQPPRRLRAVVADDGGVVRARHLRRGDRQLPSAAPARRWRLPARRSGRRCWPPGSFASDETTSRIDGHPTGTGCSSRPKPCCTRSRRAGQGPLPKTCRVSIGPQVWVSDRYAGQSRTWRRRIRSASPVSYATSSTPSTAATMPSRHGYGRCCAGRSCRSASRHATANDAAAVSRSSRAPPRCACCHAHGAPRRPRAARPPSRHGEPSSSSSSKTRDVPPTNNACERETRPSVVFRKVTGDFRSPWGAQ